MKSEKLKVLTCRIYQNNHRVILAIKKYMLSSEMEVLRASLKLKYKADSVYFSYVNCKK